LPNGDTEPQWQRRNQPLDAVSLFSMNKKFAHSWSAPSSKDKSGDKKLCSDAQASKKAVSSLEKRERVSHEDVMAPTKYYDASSADNLLLLNEDSIASIEIDSCLSSYSMIEAPTDLVGLSRWSWSSSLYNKNNPSAAAGNVYDNRREL
jgi:hypothetical protein